MKKFRCPGCKIFDYQAKSDMHKTMDSESVFKANEANRLSSNRIVSGKLGILLSEYVCHIQVGWLVGFNGIPTSISYLMPENFCTYIIYYIYDLEMRMFRLVMVGSYDKLGSLSVKFWYVCLCIYKCQSFLFV